MLQVVTAAVGPATHLPECMLAHTLNPNQLAMETQQPAQAGAGLVIDPHLSRVSQVCLQGHQVCGVVAASLRRQPRVQVAQALGHEGRVGGGAALWTQQQLVEHLRA